MTISIPISVETESRLRKQAEALGKDLANFVLEAIEEKLAVRDGGASLPQLERIAELHAWAASHPRLSYVADDSRDCIYEGREG